MATSTEKKFKVGDRVRVIKDADGRVAVGTLGTVTNEHKWGYVRVKCDGFDPKVDGCWDDADGAYPFYEEELALLTERPKFKVGDKAVITDRYKDKWDTGPSDVPVGLVVTLTDVGDYYARAAEVPTSFSISWLDPIPNPKPAETPSKYETAALEIAKLVTEKQAAYGDSFGKSGEVFRILYPNGIAPEQMDDALVMVRLVDKMFRIANKKDAFGESPWGDSNGYTLLALVRDLEARAAK